VVMDSGFAPLRYAPSDAPIGASGNDELQIRNEQEGNTHGV
jgi:hypothetical protein